MSNAPLENQAADGDLLPSAIVRSDALVRLYVERARQVIDRNEAARLLCHAAQVATQRQKDFAQAETLYRRAISYHPASREALEGLRALVEARNDKLALAEVLEKIAAITVGPESALFFARAAEHYELLRGQRERAIVCCRHAMQADPTAVTGYRMLRRMLMDDDQLSQAFEVIERERVAVGSSDLQIAYLDIASRSALIPQLRALTLKAISRARESDPSHGRIDEIVRDIDGLPTEWRERVKALRARSAEERDRRAAARQLVMISALLAYYDEKEASSLYDVLLRCMTLWPAMPQAIDLIDRIAIDRGTPAWSDALLLRLSNEVGEKAAHVDLLQCLGHRRMAKGGDREGAIVAFVEALKIDPSRHDVAEVAIAQLFALDRSDQAIAIADTSLSLMKDRWTRLSFLSMLARLCSDHSNTAAQAISYFQKAVDLDPNNAELSFKFSALCAREGRFDDAWSLFSVAMDAAVPAAEKVALCEKLAEHFQKSQDWLRCFQAQGFALPIDPKRQEAVERILATAKHAHQEPALIAMLRRLAEISTDSDQPAILRTLAQ